MLGAIGILLGIVGAGYGFYRWTQLPIWVPYQGTHPAKDHFAPETVRFVVDLLVLEYEAQGYKRARVRWQRPWPRPVHAHGVNGRINVLMVRP